MNRKLLLTLLAVLVSILYLQAQQSQTINVTQAGSLEALLSTDKTKVVDLTLTGTINEKDFATIKQMTALKGLDMSNVDIDNGTIPARAFANMVMKELVLPRSLKSIGEQAFYKATIPDFDFSKCPNLEELGVKVFDQTKLQQSNQVLDFSMNTKLTRFLSYWAGGSFSYFNGHVILPNSLKVLPTRTFEAFSGTVVFPQGLESLGNLSFYNATLPKGLNLPSSLKSIGEQAFYKTTIPDFDFSKCPNLEELGVKVFDQTKLQQSNQVLDFSMNTKLTRFLSYWAGGSFSYFNGHVILPNSLKVLPTRTFEAFSGTVVFPQGLENLGNLSFYNATLPKGLNLPSSLKSIGEQAFYKTTIPDFDFSKCPNLEELGVKVFDQTKLQQSNQVLDFSMNTKLTRFLSYWAGGSFSYFNGHVILPNSLKVLPTRTFEAFSGTVVFPQGLENLGNLSFYNATLPKGLNLPSSLKSIGEQAFYKTTIPDFDFSKCPNLEELGVKVFDQTKLQQSNQVLDFSMNTKLTRFLSYWAGGSFSYFNGHVILPNSLKVLPTRTFEAFSGTVVFPQGLENLGNLSFYNATLPKGLNLPSSLKSIGEQAFYKTTIPDFDFSKCPNLEELGVKVFDQTKLQQSNQVLDFSMNTKLTRFLSYWAGGSFSYFNGHVILPNSLKVLPTRTFEAFSGTVVFPQGLENLGNLSFYNATLPKGLNLPSSLKSIGEQAFYKTTIPDFDFSKCPNLEELGVKVFDQTKLQQSNQVLDFSMNTKLTRFLSYWAGGSFSYFNGHVILPNSLKVLPTRTFEAFSGTVVFPQGLENLGNLSFYNATLPKGLNLPSSLKSIGEQAFYKTTIPDFDFSKCPNLEELGVKVFDQTKLQQSNQVLDFSMNTKLTRFLSYWAGGSFSYFNGHVILPDDLKVLPTRTFEAFSGTVDISLKLQRIEAIAFLSSSIEEISLPRSLTYIGDNAFAGCTELTKIISNNVTPPALGRTVFNGVDVPYCRLFVPDKGLPLYAAADQWKDFINTMRSAIGTNELFQEEITQDETSVSIYPNPTTDILNIKGDNIEDIKIYSSNGKLARSASNTNTINIEDLSSGIYFIRIKTPIGVTTEKVMKK